MGRNKKEDLLKWQESNDDIVLVELFKNDAANIIYFLLSMHKYIKFNHKTQELQSNLLIIDYHIKLIPFYPFLANKS